MSVNPKITLGGQEWEIPKLAIKQNRIVAPIVVALLPIVAKLKDDFQESMTALTDEHYDELVYMCHAAVTRGNPEITEEQFEEMPVTVNEMIAAFSTIAEQSGLFEKKEGSASPGEANPASPTGTA